MITKFQIRKKLIFLLAQEKRSIFGSREKIINIVSLHLKVVRKNKNIIKSIGDIEFLKVKIDFWFIAFLFISFALLYSAIAVIRHDHFQSQGIDFSIYDQALWLYSQLEKPHSTITNLLDLADRFRPIMIPLSLLYFFTD